LLDQKIHENKPFAKYVPWAVLTETYHFLKPKSILSELHAHNVSTSYVCPLRWWKNMFGKADPPIRYARRGSTMKDEYTLSSLISFRLYTCGKFHLSIFVQFATTFFFQNIAPRKNSPRGCIET
jgi:hypothetical protein